MSMKSDKRSNVSRGSFMTFRKHLWGPFLQICLKRISPELNGSSPPTTIAQKSTGYVQSMKPSLFFKIRRSEKRTKKVLLMGKWWRPEKLDKHQWFCWFLGFVDDDPFRSKNDPSWLKTVLFGGLGLLVTGWKLHLGSHIPPLWSNYSDLTRPGPQMVV